MTMGQNNIDSKVRAEQKGDSVIKYYYTTGLLRFESAERLTFPKKYTCSSMLQSHKVLILNSALVE